MKRRAIDPEDRELWHRATADVARRRHARVVSNETKEEKLIVVPAKAGTQGDRTSLAPGPRRRGDDEIQHAGLKEPNPGLDRRTALRLKRGQLPIEARLDLHGLTQAVAHRELASFVARASTAGKRVLLIITGKGTKEGTGVLRAAVPRWLTEAALRPSVLAMAPAQPKDGGDGALYLLLRRAR